MGIEKKFNLEYLAELFNTYKIKPAEPHFTDKIMETIHWRVNPPKYVWEIDKWLEKGRGYYSLNGYIRIKKEILKEIALKLEHN